MRKNKNISKNIKAEDYEAAVIMGWYKLQPSLIINDKLGISKKVMNLIRKKPDVIETGLKIAKRILQEHPDLANQYAIQYGRVKNDLTKFWKSYGATNSTPKTDIKIGNKRFSLKIGPAQLMSGGKEESIATFYAAALSAFKTTNPTSLEFLEVKNLIDKFLPSTLVNGQLSNIIKIGDNDLINKADKTHKEIMNALSNLFKKHREFKINFAKEAMSGFNKFGEQSDASANYMLVSDHKGSNIEIHSIYDEKYCEAIADKIRIQARFKSSSRKIQGKKTGEYRAWSVISLIVSDPFIEN